MWLTLGPVHTLRQARVTVMVTSLTIAVFAEVLESLRARATVTETSLTNAVFAEVLESLRARATVTETSLTNAVFAVVLESPKARATVTKTSLTNAASVEATAVHVPGWELPSAHAATSPAALPRHGHLF